MALALGHPVGQPGILGFRHALTASKVGYGLWLCLKKRQPEPFATLEGKLREGAAFYGGESRSFALLRMTCLKHYPVYSLDEAQRNPGP